MQMRVLLICLTACWCGAIIAAPAAVSSADGTVHAAGGAVYVFFSTVCHQWESHSFHAFGHKLPVCVRCCAIYFSFFAGIVFAPSIGRYVVRRFGTRSLIAASAAGMAVDVALSSLGISESSTASRLITGGAFGLLTAFVITPLLIELMEGIRTGRALR